MAAKSFETLKGRVEFTNRMRYLRFDAFSKQIVGTSTIKADTKITDRMAYLKSQNVKVPLKCNIQDTQTYLRQRDQDARNCAMAIAFKNKQVLKEKSLGSFSKSKAELSSLKAESPRRKLAIPQEADVPSQLIRSPTLEELLAFNKSNVPKKKPLQLRSFSVKRVPQKLLEPTQYSSRLRALSPTQSLLKVQRVPPLMLDKLGQSDFAFIKVGSLTPHKNVWEERQLRTCRTPRILRVSPRYY